MLTPKNETETLIFFAQNASIARYEIVSAQVAFPDLVIARDGIQYRAEVEHLASNFFLHNHNPGECDLIICWQNDLAHTLLPVLELSNPEWISVEINKWAKSKQLEVSVEYWQSRALDAECKLASQGIITEPRPLEALTDTEIRLVTYAMEYLDGSFAIGRLYKKFKGEMSRWTIEKIARRWEARGWLTKPKHATDSRKITTALLSVLDLKSLTSIP